MPCVVTSPGKGQKGQFCQVRPGDLLPVPREAGLATGPGGRGYGAGRPRSHGQVTAGIHTKIVGPVGGSRAGSPRADTVDLLQLTNQVRGGQRRPGGPTFEEGCCRRLQGAALEGQPYGAELGFTQSQDGLRCREQPPSRGTALDSSAIRRAERLIQAPGLTGPHNLPDDRRTEGILQVRVRQPGDRAE